MSEPSRFTNEICLCLCRIFIFKGRNWEMPQLPLDITKSCRMLRIEELCSLIWYNLCLVYAEVWWYSDLYGHRYCFLQIDILILFWIVGWNNILMAHIMITIKMIELPPWLFLHIFLMLLYQLLMHISNPLSRFWKAYKMSASLAVHVLFDFCNLKFDIV